MTHNLPLICAMFISISELFFKVGLSGRGLELLAFSHHHPAGDQETKDRAEQVLKGYEAHFPPQNNLQHIEQDQQPDLETVVVATQNDLISLPDQVQPQTEPSPAATRQRLPHTHFAQHPTPPQSANRDRWPGTARPP